MFALPSAKSVRRSELDSPRSSRSASPDADVSQAAQAKLAAFFSNIYEEEDLTAGQSAETDTTEQATTRKVSKSKSKSSSKTQPKPTSTPIPDSQANKNPNPEPQPEEEEALSFRLFSNPTPSSTSKPTDAPAPNKIVIRSPTPETTEPNVVRKRDPSFYRAAPWDPAQRLAALPLVCTPATVLAAAAQHWPGCAVPWRVTTIQPSQIKTKKLQASGAGLAGGAENDAVVAQGVREGEDARSGARKKPGKKKRVVMRKRARARADKAAKDALVGEEKEAAEREKRTRRNREKKVKKKQREKAKKLGAGEGGGGGDAGADGGISDSA